MDQPLSRLSYLFTRYADDACTEAERLEFLYLVQQEENAAELYHLIDQAIENGIADRKIDASRADQIYNNVVKADHVPEVVRKLFPWRRIAVAACILILLGVGTYYVFFNKTERETEIVESTPSPKQDVAPGKYKATLRLADGSTVIIDSAASGKLTRQGSTEITNKDGQVIYEGQGKSNEVLYNTLTTARGETYATVLADGSKVWLNAASSIKFPVAFFGNERRVEITGEAYFEVTHNEKMPFIVEVNGMEVQDLGTQFNINAYGDEAVSKTTLVEGSVKVIFKGNSQLLVPGQQAQTNTAGELKLVHEVDLDEAVAWKNGRFQFNRAGLQEVMRQIARWYDVDIHYEGAIPNLQFGGKMQRNLNLSEMLDILAKSQVNYKIEGRKLTITQ